MSEVAKDNSLHIKFNFHPLYNDSQTNTVEKADNEGRKRMYIEGVASGVKLDGHSERMTEKAIGSFMNQANSGTILLYPDVHGIRATEDIGILDKAEVLPNGDWKTSFRLYDTNDDVPTWNRETAKSVWNQLAGNPPYNKPLKKGFSIEGFIPPDGIISAQKDEYGNVGKRVINDVLLDGVVICPRPAYQDSIAHAVRKALGEMNPIRRERITKNLQGALRETLQEKEINNKYYSEKWDIQSSLESEIEKIMRKVDPDKFQQIEILFDEYKTLMIELLKASESLFKKTDDDETDETPYGVGEVVKSGNSQLEKYRAILKTLLDFKKRNNY